MMTLVEIADSASQLGNQVGAGIPMAEAVAEMVLLQPQYSDFWSRAAVATKTGTVLSECMKEVWPDALISSLQAGEQSGRLETIFPQIEESVMLQLRTRKKISGIYYPAGMAVAGILIFLGFLVKVFPGVGRALPSGNGPASQPMAIFLLANWAEEVFNEYWIVILASIAIGIVSLVAWFRTEEAKSSISTFFLGTPIVGTAMRNLYFGLWANYMAMMHSAGIPTTQGLLLTLRVLPEALQGGVRAFERDLTVNNMTMKDAVNTEKMAADDPRREWPRYITNAFVMGERTGFLDRELRRSSPALIKDGEKAMDIAINYAYLFSVGLSATLILSPMAIFYLQVFTAIGRAGR